MNSEIEVATEVDAQGLDCPMPLLKMKLALNQLQSGQVVKLLATDPGSVKDIGSFCELSGNDLLKFTQSDGRYAYWIEKT